MARPLRPLRERLALPPRAALAALAAIQLAQWLAVVLLALDARSDDADPLLKALNVGVLLPVALASAYAVGDRLAGPRLGVLAAGVWAFFPFLAIPFVDPRYHDRWADGFVPRAVGLTDASEFPAMVPLLLAAAFLLHAITHPNPTLQQTVASGGAAGVAAGAACAVDGSALLFLPAAVAALALARRPRELASFAAAAAAGVAVLALRAAWPDLSGAGVWGHLHRNELLVREYFWSVRVPEWLLVAGVVGALRRSAPAGVLLGGWALAFLLARGTDRGLTVENGQLFAELLPALPAFTLLTASVPLLAPPLPAWRDVLQRARSSSRARS